MQFLGVSNSGINYRSFFVTYPQSLEDRIQIRNLIACQQVQEQALLDFTSIGQSRSKTAAEAANIVFQSTDGGQTWQSIDAGLPPSLLISSIRQMGDYFYCGHPKGIYRSADQGKSWDLLLPTIGEKVFNLSAADGLLYAVLRDGGC